MCLMSTVLHTGAVIIQYGACAASVNHQSPEQQILYLKYMKALIKLIIQFYGCRY